MSCDCSLLLLLLLSETTKLAHLPRRRFTCRRVEISDKDDDDHKDVQRVSFNERDIILRSADR